MDRWQLLSLDACMECGRCTDVCPANAVGKSLNPKKVVLNLRSLLAEKAPKTEGEGATEVTPAEEESVFPFSPSTDLISDDGIRRYRVAEGRLSGSAATMLRQLGSRENPWGLPASQRLDWARGLDIPSASAEDGREVLLWVGCAGAFDPRAQKTVRAMAQLLQLAGVRFTVLGPRERCTGDPARRTGDEFLYQQLAEANIATLTEIQPPTALNSSTINSSAVNIPT
jgi:Fe-S oxidoreductase